MRMHPYGTLFGCQHDMLILILTLAQAVSSDAASTLANGDTQGRSFFCRPNMSSLLLLLACCVYVHMCLVLLVHVRLFTSLALCQMSWKRSALCPTSICNSADHPVSECRSIAAGTFFAAVSLFALVSIIAPSLKNAVGGYVFNPKVQLSPLMHKLTYNV